ncbi:MAG: peptide chain release factor 1 [Candidatus Coatesbacteria bacterium]
MAITETERAKLTAVEKRFDDLAQELNDQASGGAGGPREARANLARSLSRLEPLATAWRALRHLLDERGALLEVMAGDDRDLSALAQEELEGLAGREREFEARVRGLLEEGERDPADDRGVILEIRAGTGGEEAGLFAADLLRMYMRFAERRGWTTETIEVSRTELGGIREAVLGIEGAEAWRWLKHEGGVHRVQRVPVTEAAGRIHTSAVTVAVLAQAEEVDIEVRPEDIRIDTFCSSGAGGQSVNTTYSAVRIVHVPTGITVQCQDERSQLKNRGRAMKVLRARLLAQREDSLQQARGVARRAQVGTGDRSEKIRTYNFPQARVTDHRIGLSIHQLRDVLDGDLNQMVEALDKAYRKPQASGAADGPSPA